MGSWIMCMIAEKKHPAQHSNSHGIHAPHIKNHRIAKSLSNLMNQLLRNREYYTVFW